MAGFDCSGLVIELLKASGVIAHSMDYAALGLLNFLKVHGTEKVSTGSSFGAIAFFGESPRKVTHCAFCLDDFSMLEAGGGSAEINTPLDAEVAGAFVRIRPLKNRSDLQAILMPRYPFG